MADFVNSMSTIYQGVLNGIFRQMPIAAWFRAQCKCIQLTIVLPSDSPLEEWQTALLCRTSCWPFRLPQEMTRAGDVALDQAGFLHPLGLRHFYDGFSLRAGISIRAAALVAFGFQENELSSDLILSQAAVVARGWADHSCFASVRGFFTIPPRVVDLDDRQGFTARSAMR